MFLLASKSPQRKKILENLGVDFKVIPSLFDESSIHERDPIKRVKLLAEGKAKAASLQYPDQYIIGADTLVVSADGELMEQPVDAGDARRMLKLHSGRTSKVHTALCMMVARLADPRGNECHTDISTTSVTFHELSGETINWWIELGLWEDRSGAFQIEGDGQKLIKGWEGEYETVVGFPVELFRRMCRELD